ncbi:MAG: hypothetical protein R2747_19455 [Pyrinomonadaceae bacterium]
MAEHLISIEDAQEDLLSCGAFLAETIGSSDGHAGALNEIVPRFIAKGEVDLAAQLSDSVEDPFVRDKLLMYVAEKCAAIDDDEYAFQLVEAIEDAGTQSMARERVALQKSAKNDTEKALEIVAELSHPDDAYADIALHQVMKGDEETGLETIEMIDFPLSRANALQNIAVHYLKNEDGGRAARFFDLAYEAAGSIEYFEEKVRAFTEIAGNLVEVGQKGRSIEILENARLFAERIDGVHRDGLLASISLGFLKAGSLDLADKTLDLVGDKTQVAACLIGFSEIFWKTDETGEAVETLEEAYAILKSQRDNEIRDSRARFRLLANVAVQFAKFNKPERGIEIAQENISEMDQLSALAQIAQVCALQGKDDIARQALNGIFEDSTRMFALIGMSDARKEAGEKEEAIGLLNEAAALCETVPQLASRSEAFNEFAVRFQEFGAAEKARAFLHENLETIAEIRDQSSRAVKLTQLAGIYEKFDLQPSEDERAILKELVRKAEVF